MSADRRRSKEPHQPQRVRTGARMLVACIYCKDHKLRCDNGVPSCANCLRFNETCLVEDPLTKRHQPRNYLDILETRIAFLEGQLRTRDGDNTPAPSGHSHTVGDVAGDDVDDPVEVDSLAATVGMLGLCATGMEPRYLGSSSAFAFSRAIRSSLLLKGARGAERTAASSSTPASGSFAAGSSCALPLTYEDGLTLSNAYFENIHIQYPFLHEPTFRMWEVQRVSSLPVPVSEPDVASFFVYIVYAIGALLMGRFDHEQLYMVAMQYMDSVLQKDNLQSVQALLACCVYSLRSPSGPSLWKLTGLALRQCIELGYHRDVRRVAARTSNDMDVHFQLRKRAFWTAFAIDCSVAMFLGRPMGLALWQVDTTFPKNIGDGNVFAGRPADLSVALHMFRLRCLWAKIHAALFTDTDTGIEKRRMRTTDAAYTARIQQLQKELDAWRATAPPEPPRSGAALSLFGSKDWYDSNYSHSVLLLHRNHLIEARAQVPADIVLACLDAAENISRGYYRQFIVGSVGCTWGCLHVLFLAGLTYLHCLWTSPAARESRSSQLGLVNNTCMDCSMVFAVMAERWDRAAPYRDIFETLSRKTMSMMMSTGGENNEATPAGWSIGAEALADGQGLEDPWEVMQWVNEDLLSGDLEGGTNTPACSI